MDMESRERFEVSALLSHWTIEEPTKCDVCGASCEPRLELPLHSRAQGFRLGLNNLGRCLDFV